MTVTVLFFAAARDAVGTGKLELTLPEGSTGRQALAELSTRHPSLAAVAARSRIAVNGEYADAESPLADGDELAVIPPVSGG